MIEEREFNCIVSIYDDTVYEELGESCDNCVDLIDGEISVS